MQGEKGKTVFVVEHMQPYLFEWCLYEYQAMKAYLQGHQAELWITNAQVIYAYEGEHKEGNAKYIKELEKCFSENT